MFGFCHSHCIHVSFLLFIAHTAKASTRICIVYTNTHKLVHREKQRLMLPSILSKQPLGGQWFPSLEMLSRLELSRSVPWWCSTCCGNWAALSSVAWSLLVLLPFSQGMAIKEHNLSRFCKPRWMKMLRRNKIMPYVYMLIQQVNNSSTY